MLRPNLVSGCSWAQRNELVLIGVMFGLALHSERLSYAV